MMIILSQLVDGFFSFTQQYNYHIKLGVNLKLIGGNKAGMSTQKTGDS